MDDALYFSEQHLAVRAVEHAVGHGAVARIHVHAHARLRARVAVGGERDQALHEVDVAQRDVDGVPA